ncbi:hypothetical protein DFH07DRAFT_852364 [Mycena maculata]|uniref:F-box domain-containing protein n=1 Tax=Mycena maculata TaxID=230809 RepID=A0AAD7MQW2_9AGAR|nr:hypothetical protein DFH07DRAFT_852364 [Mycena maculata]
MLTTANELRKHLKRLDAEIAQHELSLQLLREARTGVLEELRLSLIYPVLTLPFEITSTIFLECLPDYSDDSTRSYPSQDDAPLVFTRVCRDWRTIAISTSTLWNHVRIELDSDDGPGYIDSKWVSLLDTWLYRSEPQPLYLTISNRSYTEPDQALVDVLDRHSRRWREVTLKLPFSHFSRLGATTSPMLERLTLSAHGSPDIINPISAFRYSPMLRHVCLEGGMHSSDVILPWAQLTSLELYGASADDCLELLRSTASIVNCILDVQYASHALVLGAPLLSLRSFVFSGQAGWSTLRYMAMPALQKLDLTRCPPGPRNVAQLLQFVTRSGCQLRDLKLYVRSGVTVQTVYLLRSLPSLETIDLTLAEADAGTAIFREFKSSDNDVILPHAESISLLCIHDDNHQLLLDAVTDALAMRSQSSAENPRRLTSFTLLVDTNAPGPGPEIRQRWRELSANGLELCIGNISERWI